MESSSVCFLLHNNFVLLVLQMNKLRHRERGLFLLTGSLFFLTPALFVSHSLVCDSSALDLPGAFVKTGFPGGSEVKASASNVGDLGLIPGLGRSPGEGNGNPLQNSFLENPIVHGVTKSRTRLRATSLSLFTFC